MRVKCLPYAVIVNNQRCNREVRDSVHNRVPRERGPRFFIRESLSKLIRTNTAPFSGILSRKNRPRAHGPRAHGPLGQTRSFQFFFPSLLGPWANGLRSHGLRANGRRTHGPRVHRPTAHGLMGPGAKREVVLISFRQAGTLVPRSSLRVSIR